MVVFWTEKPIERPSAAPSDRFKNFGETQEIQRRRRSTTSRRQRARSARRRRIAVAAFSLAVIGAFAVGRSASLTSQTPGERNLPVTRAVTVAPGDTPWSLARRFGNPERNILDRVESLNQANGGALSTLRPGQRILVPIENPVEIARLQTNLASAR